MKTKFLVLAIGIMILLISWNHIEQTNTVQSKDGRIKIMIMYPNEEGKTFDLDYYTNNHMPMVAQLFGESLKSYTIDKGLSGRTPEEPVSYLAIGTFYFDELSAYEAAFAANAERILSDIPNYTTIQPVVQISEVIK